MYYFVKGYVSSLSYGPYYSMVAPRVLSCGSNLGTLCVSISKAS